MDTLPPRNATSDQSLPPQPVSAPRKVMLIFGTRPEAIKMAPVALRLLAQADLTPIITVTGQHRSMLDQVLRTFSLSPDYDLNIIRPRQTLPGLTKRLMDAVDSLLLLTKPDAVLVQGDTTTTFVSALTAFYHHIPVVHLEAGMRTGDMTQPYPEEMNRVLTARLSTLHLAATARARGHLLAEGTPASSIFITGNTVIDALEWTLSHHEVVSPSLLRILRSPKPVLLVTAHRRESWGEPMQQIAQAVSELATLEPDLLVLFPVHRNPYVSNTVRPILSHLPNVHMTQPLNYPDFVVMMKRARIILTDSGGIQEEAPSLGIPALVMRDKTERLEAVEAGTSRLIGTRRQNIVDAVLQLIHDEDVYKSMTTPTNPYGDGQATGRVIASLRHLLQGAPPPDDFVP